MKKLLFAFVALCAMPESVLATVHYVKAGASGTNNGVSWPNAYTDLQSALNTAASGDTIWVAAGVYRPVSSFPQNEVITLEVPSGVVVYGGFAGTETNLSQRNFVTNVTTLSGNIIGNPTFGSWHVVTMSAVSNTTRLDGFTITEGYADGPTLQYKCGAGLYVNGNSSPTIANCIFTNNFSEDNGGALFINTTGFATIINCSILDNQANDFGGGMFGSGNFFIQGCDFSDNGSLSAGGGAYFDDGAITIDRSFVSGNNSFNGGALFFDNGAACNLYNSLLVGNVASAFSYGVSQATPNTDVHDIRNCTIAHNKSFLSGQASVELSAISLIRNSIIWGNDAISQVSSITTNITNSIVQGITGGTGNINANPEFANPATSSAAPFNYAGYDYTLSAFSPAVDNGNNGYIVPSYANDVANNPRIYGDTVDMGAYEIAYCALPAAITHNSPLEFCPGGNVVLTANTGFHYAWSTGQSTMSITAAASGNYVVAVSNNACRGYDTVTVAVYPAPLPVITATGGVLSTTVSFTSYQWSLNGTAIPNATNPTYTPTVNGNYTVAITGANSCEGISAAYSFTTGVDEVKRHIGITLSPVPAKDHVMLNFTGIENQRCQVRISNITGAVLLTKDIYVNKNEKHKFELSGITPGMYYVHCISEGERVSLKLIVQ